MNNISMIKYSFGKWSIMLYGLALMKITVRQKLILSFLALKNMSAAFDGVYDFTSCDISHEFMIAFMKRSRSSSNIKELVIEREICETLVNIQNSFHSAVNAFSALERKHEKIVGII